MTTALNVCKKEARKLARRRSEKPAIDRVYDRPVSDHVDVVEALRRLPIRQRQALILYYWGDLPVAVVADLMGLSEGGVRAHLAKGRTALRGKLEVTDA